MRACTTRVERRRRCEAVARVPRVPTRQTARHKSLCLLRRRQGNYYGVKRSQTLHE